MPWKTRKGRPYFYRNVREGDRVRSEYFGSGPRAEMAARVEAEYRAVGALERAAWRDERQALDAEDLRRADRFAGVEAVVRAILEAVGYRRHNRGEWRRPRMKTSLSAASPPPPAPLAEIRDVLAKVQAGDKQASARLKELIALDPARMIPCAGGDLAYQVEAAAVERLAKSNPIFGVSVPAKLDALRAELGGASPTPVERLLVERAVLCWLDLHALEMGQSNGGEMSIRQADYRERLRDRAHRRYLSSLRSLATVRKLGLVAVLINVDQRTEAAEPAGPDLVV